MVCESSSPECHPLVTQPDTIGTHHITAGDNGSHLAGSEPVVDRDPSGARNGDKIGSLTSIMARVLIEHGVGAEQHTDAHPGNVGGPESLAPSAVPTCLKPARLGREVSLAVKAADLAAFSHKSLIGQPPL